MKNLNSMREIKFRGKRINNSKWLYGDLMHDTVGGCYVFPIDCAALYKENEVFPNSVGQYTGLRDKNGKEIYEGDIIRSFDSNGDTILHCIVWEEARFVALYKGRNFSSKCFLKQDWLDEFDKEVIGNTHDNPELLTK